MKSDSILIHGGAGALGQALISMGLAMGYQVFTTVSDSAKKRFLMRLFPNLKGMTNFMKYFFKVLFT